MNRLISLVAFLILMLAGSAQPATIYVNNHNSCPGSGTSQSPYCRIQNALDVAAPGTDIRIQNTGTTYNEEDTLTASGTSGHPITIESDVPSNPPTLTDTVDVSNSSAQLFLNAVNYVTVQNLKWDGTGLNVGAFAIYAHTNTSINEVGIQILNNTITNWGSSNTTLDYSGHGNAAIEWAGYCNLGISVASSVISGNTIAGARYTAIEQLCPLNNKVLNNTISGTVCGRFGTAPTFSASNGEVGDEPLREDCYQNNQSNLPNVATNTLYQGNSVSNTVGTCTIGPEPATGWAAWFAGIHVDDGCGGGTIAKNIFHDMVAPSWSTAQYGILLEQHTAGWTVTNNLVYNMSGGNGPRGISVGPAVWTAGTNAPFVVAGNTVYNVADDGIGATMGTTFRDNISFNNGGAGYFWLAGSCPNCSFDYNLEWDTNGGTRYGRYDYNSGPVTFTAWKAFNPAGTDAHTIVADPLLASPSTGSFLQPASSPALHAGIPVSSLTTDLLGVSRPNPPSMGCYEYPN